MSEVLSPPPESNIPVKKTEEAVIGEITAFLDQYPTGTREFSAFSDRVKLDQQIHVRQKWIEKRAELSEDDPYRSNVDSNLRIQERLIAKLSRRITTRAGKNERYARASWKAEEFIGALADAYGIGEEILENGELSYEPFERATEKVSFIRAERLGLPASSPEIYYV